MLHTFMCTQKKYVCVNIQQYMFVIYHANCHHDAEVDTRIETLCSSSKILVKEQVVLFEI